MYNNEIDLITDIYGSLSHLRCANIILENKAEIKEENIQTYKKLISEIKEEVEILKKYIECAHNHLK